MSRYYKQSLLSRIFFNTKVITLIGVIALVLISIPLKRNLEKRFLVNKEIEGLRLEIEALEEENLDLSQMMEYLESDQFQEEQARLNFGLRKEGENVAVIQLGSEIAAATTTPIDKQKNKINSLPNPQKWKKYFLGPRQ